VRGVVGLVLRAVDSVHGDGGLPRLPVNLSSLVEEYAEASYYFDSASNTALRIWISPDAEVPELSFLHELAHFVDHKGFGQAGERQQKPFASEGNPLLSEWRRSVFASEAASRLREVSEFRSARVALDDGTSVSVDIDRAYVEYLLEPKELFARSYAQYVVVNSQNKTLQRQLDGLRYEPLASLYPLQWEEADFLAIADALDDVFQQQGWIK